jgi:DNA-binding protein H-NS
MAKSYSQMQKQIAKLQREAEGLKKKEIGGVVERIKTAIAHYELTPEDLFGGPAKRSAPSKAAGKGSTTPSRGATQKGKKIPIKYRDENGNTWTSRGSKPRWLVAALESGRKIEDFLVKPH